jgi:hemerythrin
MYFVSTPKRQVTDGRWRGSASTQKHAIIKLAKEVHTLKSRGCVSEAMEVEHEAIKLVQQRLKEFIVCGASRAEVIELLNTSIAFCASHITHEEGFMRQTGCARMNAHVAAHKKLLTKVVGARRSASGEGLSLATLNAIDSLRAFHRHVRTWDLAAAVAPKMGLAENVMSAGS